MLDMLSVVAGQVLILFLMMAVGFLLTKFKKLTPAGVSQLSFLLLNVSMPCVVVDALQVEKSAALVRHLILTALLVFLFYLFKILAAHLCSRKTPEDTRATLRFGMVFGNVGFMGIPLIRSIFGDAAVAYAAMAMAIFNVYQWTYGVIIMGGRGQISLKKALISPGIIGTVIGFVLFLTNTTLPAVPEKVISFLGDLNTPLAMIVIGAQMANTDMTRTFSSLRIWAASSVKLLIIPAVAALIMLPMRLDGVMYAALVTLAATPTAGSTSIFAQQFARDTTTSAQLVTLSTLVSILTLPLFTVFAQYLIKSF